MLMTRMTRIIINKSNNKPKKKKMDTWCFGFFFMNKWLALTKLLCFFARNPRNGANRTVGSSKHTCSDSRLKRKLDTKTEELLEEICNREERKKKNPANMPHAVLSECSRKLYRLHAAARFFSSCPFFPS